jgi:hypothetical protein
MENDVSVCLTLYRLKETQNRYHYNQYDLKRKIKNKFLRKVTSGQITEKNVTPLMLFNGRNLLYIFAVRFEGTQF